MSDSSGEALDEVLLVSDLSGSRLVKVLVARFLGGLVEDNLLQEAGLGLSVGLVNSLVKSSDLLSDSLDRNREGSFFLSDERVPLLDLFVEFLSECLATALSTVVDLSLADLFLSDLDDAFEPLSLKVGDVSLALCLGDQRLRGEELLLPLQFFLFEVLGFLLVELNLDVEGLGDGLCQRSGHWTQTLLVMLLVVVDLVVNLMMMNFVVVTMVHLVVVAVAVLVMVDMMVMLVAVTSVVDVDLDVSVMSLVVVVSGLVVVDLMVTVMTTNSMMVMFLTVLLMAVASLVVMSAWASVLVASVEFLVVLLETFHQTSLVNMVLVSVLDPPFHFLETAMESTSLCDNKVSSALRKSLSEDSTGMAWGGRRVALGQLSEGVRWSFVKSEFGTRSALCSQCRSKKSNSYQK